MLAEKGISKTQFREKLGISTATLAKLSSDKPVSSDVLARICEYFSCGLENVVIYVSDMEQFFINIDDKILGWKYTVYIDKWPECIVRLTKQQFSFCNMLDKSEFQKIIKTFELQANAENIPNAGIIDTTQVRLDPIKETIIINASFAVTEKLILWIIQNAL